MNIDYQILLSVTLSHAYFSEDKNIQMTVYPTKDTLAMFENIDVLWRKRGNTFIALIRENGHQEPFINQSPEKHYRQYFKKNVFRLYLALHDDNFYNYTNVTKGNNQIFYFNNLANNKIIPPPSEQAQLFLSQRIEDFQIGKEYIPGDFAVEPTTNNVFESLQKQTANALTQLTESGLWRPSSQSQYPTNKDLISYTGTYYTFMLALPLKDINVKIFGFNFDTEAPDFSKLIRTEVLSFDQAVNSVRINLDNLLPGRYKLQVGEEERMIYLDPYLTENNIFGVIEIYNHLPPADDYSFLDAEEFITQKKYSIHFPVRNVLWKYIRKDSRAQSITDTGSAHYTFNLIGNEFISALPIPLSETPVNTFKLNLTAPNFDVYPLPNPSAKRLKRHQQNDYDYATAEIFLNY